MAEQGFAEPHGIADSAEAVASVGQAGRRGYGGYPPRIHPQVYSRGFLRKRVKKILDLWHPTETGNKIDLFDIINLLRH